MLLRNGGANGLHHARIWHLVDAQDKGLGKLAQRIGIALRGKYKPYFNPQCDTGDYVVVINASKVCLSGNKQTEKLYRWHSGYPGGLNELTFAELQAKNPTAPITKAVYGLLPKNNLRKVWMKRLFVFEGSEHPYSAETFSDYEHCITPVTPMARVEPKQQSSSSLESPNDVNK